MTRKKFLRDLEQARQHPPHHIKDIKQYEADGLSFTFWYLERHTRHDARLNLLSTSVDDYPGNNSFLFFTDEHDVHSAIQSLLEHLQFVIDGMTVQAALKEISDALYDGLTAELEDNHIMPDVDAVRSSVRRSPAADDSDFDDHDYDSDDNFGLDAPKWSSPAQHTKKDHELITEKEVHRLKLDLRATRNAGFRVGVYGSLASIFAISISVRIARLGISEQALQAWGVSKHQYLVLLIRFDEGYKNLSRVKGERILDTDVIMRVGLCTTYKPREQDALACSDQSAPEKSDAVPPKSLRKQPDNFAKLTPLFIGRPINQLLRDRFAQIIRFRSMGMSWDNAEQCFNKAQGSLQGMLSGDLQFKNLSTDDTNMRALPKLIATDALLSTPVEKASLPLVAMQFLLRHFVRCTEFCLVCHCKVPESFEALKPYVCSNPLCLYQYLALGFGPSVEWEVMSQPYVVDLLVSLCFAQTYVRHLKELPHGIGLRVPLLESYEGLSIPNPRGSRVAPNLAGATASQSAVDLSSAPPHVTPPSTSRFPAELHQGAEMFELDVSAMPHDLQIRGGEWLALAFKNIPGICHCRVRNRNGLKIFLDDKSAIVAFIGIEAATKYSHHTVECFPYNTNFDDLPLLQQYGAILEMLETLPTVSTMRKQLVQQQACGHDASLNTLTTIPAAARDLLRWIVASNRSCIMQVDKVDRDASGEQLKVLEPRVTGMDEWMQFRFAQGAPDKEQRFSDCVKKTTAGRAHPTLFAWHGSPLHNWHSIIRSGLNYDYVAHGRANGHGVYMSPWLSTSIGYSGRPHAVQSTARDPHQWSKSELKISTVVSLQEVVNEPEQFISRTPHIVIQHKDWIQTRYLFVKTAVKHLTSDHLSAVFKQDPKYPLTGLNSKGVGTTIQIPINAGCAYRGPDEAKSGSNGKKLRTDLDSFDDEEWDTLSQDTVQEDRQWLDAENFDEREEDNGFLSGDDDDCILVAVRDISMPSESPSWQPSLKRKKLQASYLLDASKTEFIPGNLNISNIKFLPPPSDATVSATRALMKAFTEIRKTQESTPLHELGFYIDPERVDNMYQWIVELHSFDHSLPLTHDLKSANLTSIVLELLFTNDYPYSPPFVRVVTPRFLPFLHGGGGHVTEGGAICMELLTSNGWSAVCSIENVLLQIRLAMCDEERPARLLTLPGKSSKSVSNPYAVGEALQAFKRACAKHGWKEPQSFTTLMRGL